jgi:hypothetical protein
LSPKPTGGQSWNTLSLRRLIPQEGCNISYDKSLWKVIEVNVVVGTVKLSTDEGRQIILPSTEFEKIDGRWQIRKNHTP